MKNLGLLQKKYELAAIQNYIAEQQYNRIQFLINNYLTEAPVASAQQQQTNQPQNLQQAVQQVPRQQLPTLIDQLIGQIAKTDPQAFAALQAAVQSNNANAINQIISKYSAQAPVRETTIEEVIIDECVKYAYENNDIVTIQKLHEFVESGGDTKIITNFISENCSFESTILGYQEIYSEAWKDIASNIGKGLKAAGKGLASGLSAGLEKLFGGAGKFIGKYGPWAALGAVAGGPIGAAAVPLIKAALNKWSGTVSTGSSTNSKKSNKPNKSTPAQQTPAQQTPAQQTPAQQTPAQQTPAQQTPAQQTPAQQTPPAAPATTTTPAPAPATAPAPAPGPGPTTTPSISGAPVQVITPEIVPPEPSTAVVPDTDRRLVPARRRPPIKNVTPVNEFYNSFKKAINSFKNSSKDTPIERANKK